MLAGVTEYMQVAQGCHWVTPFIMIRVKSLPFESLGGPG